MITGNESINPVVIPGLVYADGSYENPFVKEEGLTIRQYFAAMAMAALIPTWVEGSRNHKEMIVTQAIEISDALINELNKKP